MRSPCILALLPGLAFACISLSIEGSAPLSLTEEFYASWNIDSSRQRAFFDTNFSNPQLLYLASIIGGARIRFGGTGNDYLHYDVPSASPCLPTQPFNYECLNTTWLDNLFALSSAADSPLIFGLCVSPQQQQQQQLKLKPTAAHPASRPLPPGISLARRPPRGGTRQTRWRSCATPAPKTTPSLRWSWGTSRTARG